MLSLPDRAAPSVAQNIHSLIEAGVYRARRLDRPILVSLVRPVPAADPLAFFARQSSRVADRLFWSSPTEGYALAGSGAAWTLDVAGSQRFAAAAAAWRECCTDALIDSATDATGTGPLLLGGFAFDPLRPATPTWAGFPDGRLVLPRYLLTRHADATWLTLNAVVDPDSSPEHMARRLLNRLPTLPAPASLSRRVPPEQGLTLEELLPAQTWMAIVRALVQTMQHGDLEKIVLARACRVAGRRPFDPGAVLAQLRSNYPGCFGFAVARGEACFLGASPERLVRLQQGTVQATSLAGSIRRGSTPEEDRQLGAALLASAKDRAEHAIVARTLADALSDLCTELTMPETPTLMKMSNVQHLYTPLVGQVAGARTVLELLERLHPTPAVGGSPHERALPLIREREQLDRGWYAAPVGWIDARGEGEFAVAIRSALLRGATATLFAGCGLVADSDPAAEYAESQLKLRPLLTALGGELL